jgi:antitoxin VapB
MTLNIKNQEVEQLLNEIVQMTGESKTEAIRKALEERRQRLSFWAVTRSSEARLLTFLQDEVWPHVPPESLETRLTKAEEEEILGYGEHGV